MTPKEIVMSIDELWKTTSLNKIQVGVLIMELIEYIEFPEVEK